VEELAVSASADFVDNSGLEVEENSAGYVLASASLAEEGVEGVISTTDGLVRGHLTVWLDTVLQAEKFPASIAYLDTSLSYVN